MLRRGPEERTLYKHGYYYYSCDYRWGLGEPQTGSDLAEAGRDRGVRLGSTSRGPPPGIVTKAAGATQCPHGNAIPLSGDRAASHASARVCLVRALGSFGSQTE